MKIRKLISKLSLIEKEHGNIEVLIDDADTNWLMHFDVEYCKEEERYSYNGKITPERVELSGGYDRIYGK
jgi:hypothetical protein